jgi:hypothetical protein
MSEYTLAGVYVEESADDIRPTPVDTGRYVAVIGHMQSGTSDYGLVDADKFGSGSTGTVFVYDSIVDYKNKMGTASGTSTWSNGTRDLGPTSDSPYCKEFNFMRAAELAFAGGAKRVYGCILTGSGTDAETSPTGLTEALQALRAFDDVYYVVVAGANPIQAVTTEMVTASAAEEGKERVYVTGTSMQRALSGSAYTYEFPATDKLAQSDNGRSICVLANTKYRFAYQSGDITDTNLRDHADLPVGTKEIGGNFLAAFVAGRLSGQDAHVPLSYISGWVPSYKGETNLHIFGKSDLESMWNDYTIFPRRWTTGRNSTWSYDKGWMFIASTSADVQLITTRQILDTIAKDARNLLRTFLFRPNTTSTRASAKAGVDRKLAQRKREGMVKAFSSDVYASATDEANNIMRCRIDVTPVFETLKIVIQLTATLTIG